MIPKKKEDYLFSAGEGRPFEMPERPGEPKTEKERQKSTVINLSDLNSGTGMPKNFHTKRGRVLLSFTKYWSPDEARNDQEEGFDIE